jgi:hypothetical protein
MHIDPLVARTAKEYLETIRAIQFGQGTIEEIHEFEGQRAVLHDQLLSMLGLTRSSDEDMVRLAQSIVLQARAEGWME